MECPNCGSRHLGYRPGPVWFARVTMFHCLTCGFSWAHYGAPDTTRVQWRRERAVFWQGLFIYVRIAVVVWGIASVLLLLVELIEPWTAATRLGARWIYVGFGSLFSGVCLGIGLNLAGLIGGFLRNRIMIIFLPLLCGGLVGGIQAAILSLAAFSRLGTDIAVRSAALAIPVGVLLGLVATPIVIVRASKACRRRNLRPPYEGSSGDNRWDS